MPQGSLETADYSRSVLGEAYFRRELSSIDRGDGNHRNRKVEMRFANGQKEVGGSHLRKSPFGLDATRNGAVHNNLEF